MSQHYNQDYTHMQIESILKVIQDCIRCNRYIIAKNENRAENRYFIDNYHLSVSKQKDILLRIEPEDFCHSLKNTKIGFEHEVLYVFCPRIKLFDFDGNDEQVDIYIKFNIIDYEDGKQVIAISFHKRNRPIHYMFR